MKRLLLLVWILLLCLIVVTPLMAQETPTPVPDDTVEQLDFASDANEFLLEKLDESNQRFAVWSIAITLIIAGISSLGLVLLYRSTPTRRTEIKQSALNTVDQYREKANEYRQDALNTPDITDDLFWGGLYAGLGQIRSAVQRLPGTPETVNTQAGKLKDSPPIHPEAKG